MMQRLINDIIATVRSFYPDTQAMYLFGSWGTAHERPDSDVDLAVLLPPDTANSICSFVLHDLPLALELLLNRDVDFINLRQVPTIFQLEIIFTGRRILCADEYAADLFEIRVMGNYQKLNQERAGILAAGLESGRFYQ